MTKKRRDQCYDCCHCVFFSSREHTATPLLATHVTQVATANQRDEGIQLFKKKKKKGRFSSTRTLMAYIHK